MLERFKPIYSEFLTPIALIFKKLKIKPNIISILGALLLVIGSIFIVFHRYYTALFIMLVGGLLDGVDGKVARETKNVTKFGAFLDSTMDRIAEILIGVILFVYLYNLDINELLKEFILYLAIYDMGVFMLISYVKARAEGLGIECKGGIYQRSERGLLLGILLLFKQVGIIVYVVLSAILGTYTVYQRIKEVYNNYKFMIIQEGDVKDG